MRTLISSGYDENGYAVGRKELKAAMRVVDDAEKELEATAKRIAHAVREGKEQVYTQITRNYDILFGWHRAAMSWSPSSYVPETMGGDIAARVRSRVMPFNVSHLGD